MSQKLQSSPRPSKPKGSWKTKVATVGSIIGLIVAVFQLLDHFGVSAQRPEFFCDKDLDGTPITVFSHPNRGDIIIIRWESSYFKEAGFDAQSRCQEVSPKFQNYRKQGKLQYITTGRKNGYNIICVAEADQKPCLNDQEQGQLWTLKPGANPSEVVAAIKALRYGDDKSKVLVESQQVWIDVDDLLEHNPIKPLF